MQMPPEWYEGFTQDAIDAEAGSVGDPHAQLAPDSEYEYDQRHDGEHFFAGVYGQYIWVDEKRDV